MFNIEDVSGLVNGAPVFGAPVDAQEGLVQTEIYRYLLDKNGKPTNYVRRSGGREIRDIVRDLRSHLPTDQYAYENIAMGVTFEFRLHGDCPESECPEHKAILVHVSLGGSEGHLVHVVLLLDRKDGIGTTKPLAVVKTFAGVTEARRIASKLEEVLGVV